MLNRRPDGSLHWRDGRPRIVNEMIERAAKRESLHPTEVLSRSHRAPCVAARCYVIEQLREQGYSLSRIGRVLGGLHRRSIWHHVRKMALKPKPEPFNPDIPDESGIWAI